TSRGRRPHARRRPRLTPSDGSPADSLRPAQQAGRNFLPANCTRTVQGHRRMTTTTTTATKRPAGPAVRLGLRENWLQFTLLVVVNMAVGGLVGLERTTVPLIGTDVFGLTSDLAVFSFI